MPFIYCTGCGYKNVFTTRQAKFCAGCGQSLLEESAGKTPKAANNRSQSTRTNNVQEEDFDTASIPNIQKLEYTVDSVQRKQTVGDLINTKKEGDEKFERSSKANRGKPKTREELEAESIRECATSKTRSAN